MKTPLEQLDRWLQGEEDEHLEFKEAKLQFSFSRLVGYCVALANERGGKLILGVTNRRPRRIVGTQAFRGPRKVKAKLFAVLHLRIEAEEVEHPDGRVLVFHVPSRPTGTPLEHKGTYWMREGESLVGMSPDMLKRIVGESQPDFSAEVCSGATLEHLDHRAIGRFGAMWGRKSRPRSRRAVFG